VVVISEKSRFLHPNSHLQRFYIHIYTDKQNYISDAH
jgi:hypothetical protein